MRINFSWTLLLVGVFIAYVSYSLFSLYQLFTPPPCPRLRDCYGPFLEKHPDVVLSAFVSTKRRPFTPSDVTRVFEWRDFDYRNAREIEVNITLPPSTRNNGSLYLHVFVAPKTYTRIEQLLSPINVQFDSVPLTKFLIPDAVAFNLLRGGEPKKNDSAASRKSKKPVTHWKPSVQISVVSDLVPLPVKGIPMELANMVHLNSLGDHYLPLLYIDRLTTRIKDYEVLDADVPERKLSVKYVPISFGRLRWNIHMSLAMRGMTNLGFTEKDLDEVKGIFMDTNLYLLYMTFIVAAVHLLFDFLAFKNDVSFWRKRRTMVGVSVRTLIWRMVSSVIIFLYLMDEKTSLLVLVPAGIGCAIEVWKLFKAFKITIVFTGFRPTLLFGENSADEERTSQYDAQFMRYLSYLLYPLCLGGAVYSLFYTPHKSWYSWCVHSMVNGVYAFGFLLMLPQLFINYRMKSVAHLPWRAFMYKAFNTFIDDIFAFIITMPTSHRVACFRDDVVFLVYLYQRWLYPVDKTRLNEFGESFETEPAKGEASKKQD